MFLFENFLIINLRNKLITKELIQTNIVEYSIGADQKYDQMIDGCGILLSWRIKAHCLLLVFIQNYTSF